MGATFLGWLLGVVLIVALSSLLDSVGIEGLQFYLGLGMGSGIGLMQWFNLRKSGRINGRWILINALGMGIPFLFFDLVFDLVVEVKIFCCMFVGAFLIALLQHYAFRNLLKNPWVWILSSVVGWLSAAAITFSVDYTNAWKAILPIWALALINLFLILAGGLILGLISGIALRKFFSKEHIPEN